MLRAPGTYHHSVSVAQLSEAAAEAVGANGLQTRVACYFHDIGKAVHPKYFIENQRGGPNPHDKLSPRASARVIINHVVDGEAIALQYKLPQPIIDGIVMHHGTGLIQYFYAMALKEAKPGEVVREADFRYPGRLPDTREAGIIMLADKVEAATRTLKDKSPENLRALIQKLVNSTLMDGQLEKCPLTIKDLYTIIDAFNETLLGIYHHRIDYPGLPSREVPSEAPAADRPSGPVITLEIQNPLAQKTASSAEAVDTPEVRTPVAPEAPVVEIPVIESATGPIDPQTGLPFMRPQRSITPDEDYESADHIPTPEVWPRGTRNGK
jgi:putative nucleotidyltransferase with HDIG domain